MRNLALLALAFASACGTSDPDPCGAEGTCDPNAVCELPDVDCFEANPDPSVEYSGRDDALAQRAWAMLGEDIPLGDLADAHIAVIYVDAPYAEDRPTARDGRLPLAIREDSWWHDMPDDQVLGEMLHRLAHLVHLDGLRDVDRTYPDTITHDTVETWARAASLVGVVDDDRFGGLPMSDEGQLDDPFFYGMLSVDASCGSLVDDIITAEDHVDRDWLSGAYLPSASALVEISNVMSRVASCRSVTLEKALGHYGLTGDTLSLAADEQTLLGQPAAVAIMTITASRRAAMRQAEHDYTAATGRPWSAVRFRSAEDDADELALSVSSTHGLAGGFVASLRTRLGDDLIGPCDASIAAGTVPFGVYLDDEHHSLCWRIARAMGAAR